MIGTVATLPYGPFTWMSMVLVDPKARRRGVGTLLLERGLALVPNRWLRDWMRRRPARRSIVSSVSSRSTDWPGSSSTRDRAKPADVGCATAHTCGLAGPSRQGHSRVRRIAR